VTSTNLRYDNDTDNKDAAAAAAAADDDDDDDDDAADDDDAQNSLWRDMGCQKFQYDDNNNHHDADG